MKKCKAKSTILLSVLTPDADNNLSRFLAGYRHPLSEVGDFDILMFLPVLNWDNLFLSFHVWIIEIFPCTIISACSTGYEKNLYFGACISFIIFLPCC